MLNLFLFSVSWISKIILHLFVVISYKTDIPILRTANNEVPSIRQVIIITAWAAR